MTPTHQQGIAPVTLPLRFHEPWCISRLVFNTSIALPVIQIATVTISSSSLSIIITESFNRCENQVMVPRMQFIPFEHPYDFVAHPIHQCHRIVAHKGDLLQGTYSWQQIDRKSGEIVQSVIPPWLAWIFPCRLWHCRLLSSISWGPNVKNA